MFSSSSPLFPFIYSSSKHSSSFSFVIQTFTKVYACVAVIFCGPHMPCPFLTYTSICSPLRTTPLTNTSKTVPCPNIDIISWHLGNSNQSFLTLPCVHLRSSCCLCKHKTNISLSQRVICLCDRLMEICVFRKQTGCTWASLLKGMSKFWIVYFERFFRKPGFTLHPGFKSSVMCAEKFVVSTTNVLPPPEISSQILLPLSQTSKHK